MAGGSQRVIKSHSTHRIYPLFNQSRSSSSKQSSIISSQSNASSHWWTHQTFGDSSVGDSKWRLQSISIVKGSWNGVSNACSNCLFNVNGIRKSILVDMENWNQNTDRRCDLAIIDLRNRSGAETVEVIKYLRWWIENGFVKGVLEILTTEKYEDLINMEMEMKKERMENLYGW